MKKNKVLPLLPCIFLLFNACPGFERRYEEFPSEVYVESTDNSLPISTRIYFLGGGRRIFPFHYLQPILPLPYEKHLIMFTINNFNDIRKRIKERENENYMDDVMLFMYIDEFRIVLPSGRIIDLLDGKIDVIYYYNGSKDPKGKLNESVENVKPQYINGVKMLFFDGIKDGDGLNFHFYTKIPAYFVNRVRIEYTLNFEWENHGTVKTREFLIYNKEWGSFVYFSA